MPDFDDHNEVLNLVKDAQSADSDNREKVREVQTFINKPDGQWEQHVTAAFKGRPRYTFDLCNDIVDTTSGHMDQADFGITVRPAGGDATKELAATYNGLIRHIQSASKATRIYNKAGSNVIAAGLDGWEVVQRWGSADSFDQELFVDDVPNFVDTVWFDPTSTKEDRSDSAYAFKLETMSADKYKEKWPNKGDSGTGVSIGDDRTHSVYFQKAKDTITIGSIYYKEPAKREFVEMTNGAIYVVDDDYQKVSDELKVAGITEVRRRTRDIDEIKIRLFDGGGWLNDAQDTVFDRIPLVPAYGNFKIAENKVLYRGIITHKMDRQRIYNYSESRKVENGVLAPVEKIAMTTKQMEGHTEALSLLNTNNSPILEYNPDGDAPPPYKIAGPSPDPSLGDVSISAQQGLQSSINMPGQPAGLRSGVAVELEQDDQDLKDVTYFGSMEVAIGYTAEILVAAIPKLYDARRQIRVLGEDGTSDTVTLNDRVMDEDTNEMVEINNLSHGIYDVVCKVGPTFKNRQSEMTAGFLEAAAVAPQIMSTGLDIYLKNITTPGVDLIAERVRAQMIQAGQIPVDQMTDEEKEQAQAAQQQEPPQDPNMVFAQAEMLKAQNAQQQGQDRTQLEVMKLENARVKLDQDAQKLEMEAQGKQIDLVLKNQAQQADIVNKNIDGLVKLIQAGAPPVLLQQQAAITDESQDNVN